MTSPAPKRYRAKRYRLRALSRTGQLTTVIATLSTNDTGLDYLMQMGSQMKANRHRCWIEHNNAPATREPMMTTPAFRITQWVRAQLGI